MRILLTGSTGWLGRHLAPKLIAVGHTVVGLDIAAGPHTDVVGGVADRTLVERTFAEHAIEAVIHAGALHKPDIARFSAQDFIDTNITGTLNLLQAATAAGHDRFIFTSTTSLMISREIRSGDADTAVWLDEAHAPLEPRNIYGVTKLAAERLCRQFHITHGLHCMILRTSRFFPEMDDTRRDIDPVNLKAVEMLHRRLTVQDAANAHIAALDAAPRVRFGLYIASAPTPFHRADCAALKKDARHVIEQHFPQAPRLFAARGWTLPRSIGRVYDASAMERDGVFRCATDFGSVLRAMERGEPMPFVHDPAYSSPSTRAAMPGRRGDPEFSDRAGPIGRDSGR